MIHQFTGYGRTGDAAMRDGSRKFTDWHDSQSPRYTGNGDSVFSISGSLCFVPALSGSDDDLYIYVVTVFDPRRDIK